MAIRQPASATKRENENNKPPSRCPFTWHRTLALVLLGLATLAAPEVRETVFDTRFVHFASSVAYDIAQTMGQRLSNTLGFKQVQARDSGRAGWTRSFRCMQGNEGGLVCSCPPLNPWKYPVFPEAEKHREEAARQVKLRTAKLAESQSAYQTGHKANAHEQSIEGKRHGRLMDEANERAAQAILMPQNSDETGVLDLHGLYVKEAEGATQNFLDRQQRARRLQKVEIITGAGRQSSDHHAKPLSTWSI